MTDYYMKTINILTIQKHKLVEGFTELQMDTLKTS